MAEHVHTLPFKPDEGDEGYRGGAGPTSASKVVSDTPRNMNNNARHLIRLSVKGSALSASTQRIVSGDILDLGRGWRRGAEGG